MKERWLSCWKTKQKAALGAVFCLLDFVVTLGHCPCSPDDDLEGSCRDPDPQHGSRGRLERLGSMDPSSTAKLTTGRDSKSLGRVII